MSGDGERTIIAASLGRSMAQANRLSPKVGGSSVPVLQCYIHHMNRVNSCSGCNENI